jgi:hypothetical protein
MSLLKIWLRNTYINIFSKKILLIEKNNIIIDDENRIKLINIFYNFNLEYLLKYYNYNIIYEIDDLIFYDDNTINNNNVKIILYVELVEHSKDITSDIKKYSLNTPLYIIIKLEKFNLEETIKFNTLDREIVHKLLDIIDKKLYEII